MPCDFAAKAANLKIFDLMMLSILVSVCEGFLVFRGFPALVGDSPSSCLASVLRFGNTDTALCGRFLARVNGYGNGHYRHPMLRR